MNLNFHQDRAKVYMNGLLSGIAIKAKRIYTLVHEETQIDEACTAIYEEDAGPTTRSNTTKFGRVMPSTCDSDSCSSGPSRNIPRGEKPKDPIQELQDLLEW